MEVLNILNPDTINLLNRNNLLIPLIKSELVKEALTNVQLSEEEEEKIKLAIISKNKLKNEGEFIKWIEEKGKSIKDYLNEISEPLRLNNYCLKEFSHIVERKNKASNNIKKQT